MTSVRKSLLRVVLAAMVWPGACVPDAAPTPLSPAQKLELDTLTAQVADETRSAKTHREAARLLLQKEYPQAAEALRAFLDDPSLPHAQEAIAEALVEAEHMDRRYLDPLLDMLQGDEPSVRAAAARALVMHQNHGVSDKLIAIVRDRNQPQSVRLATLSAMQRLVSKPCARALIDLLRDPDPAICAAASDSLARLTSIRAYGADVALWEAWWRRNGAKDRAQWLAELADTFTRTQMTLQKENAELQERLVRAMQEFYNVSDKAQRPSILLNLLDDPIADIRLLGTTLAEQRISANEEISPDLRQRIRAILEDSDPRVRQAAALLEATLADERAVEALLGRLRIETVPEVRVGLLKALGTLKSLKALEVVLSEIRARNQAESAAAAEALARIVSQAPLVGEAKAQAAQTLMDRHRQAQTDNLDENKKNAQALREALLRAMGVVGDPAAVEVLREALGDKAGTIRLAAITGLNRLNAVDTVESIRPLAEDSDRGVRQVAVATLAKLGGLASLDLLRKRIDPKVESDSAVRKEAQEGLLAVCRQADAPVAEGIVRSLEGRKEMADLYVQVLGMLVEKLRANRSDSLIDRLRRLGEALTDARHFEEAVPPLGEAYALAKAAAAQSPSAGSALETVWAEYARGLLQANDPKFATVLAERPDQDASDSFQRGVKMLRARIEVLMAQARYLPAITLAEETLTQVSARLSAEQRSALKQAVAQAKTSQRDVDNKQVLTLLAKLQGGDSAVAKDAADQLKSLGDRAVPPLLEALRKSVSADSPDAQVENAILDLLKQLAPKLEGYNPTAAREQKLERIDAWRKMQ
jgi:HEAT repeat protein